MALAIVQVRFILLPKLYLCVFNLTDIDECISMTKPCGNTSDCNNILGSYTCVCRQGFIADGSGYCGGKTYLS